jgi:hypothetical protein
MPRKTLRERNNPADTSKNYSRVRAVIDNLIGTEDADDLMFSILEKLDETSIVPDVGKYYVFVYSPKTFGVTYDAHPFVAVTNVYRWGFKGINFHWGKTRQYSWEEVVGSLHKVYPQEIKDLKALPFQKINRA